MPFYKELDGKTPESRRTIEGLLRLKEALDHSIPPKTVDPTLLLATWNIREFGGEKYGGRTQEALFYIAEIMSRFDMIAVQEVRDNLDALDQLMHVLGGWWKYLVSDVTLGVQGNRERHAYIFDTRKILFGGLAGELVPQMKKTNGMLSSDFAFARTPYIAGFRAGWFKFSICTQHFYYGEARSDDPQRQKESETVVKLLHRRMKSKDHWALNTILLGDFNIFDRKDETYKVFEKNKFKIPASLKKTYTNANQDKPFDQIAFLACDVDWQMDIIKADTFPFFKYVYRDADRNVYLPDGTDKEYRMWRTFQLSDHLPLWVELQVDFGTEYLKKKLSAPSP
jgi:endonuclease/exonuclease/phosphatase family metal-dependent hydrolase